MHLRPGDSAPIFAAKTMDGTPFHFSLLRGKRVLLTFYRAISCPLCSLRVWYLQQRAATWLAQGLAIVAVFESSVSETVRYTERISPGFAIIPDPGKRLFRLYSASRSLKGMIIALFKRRADRQEAYRLHLGARRSHGDLRLMPMEFLIDEHGVITVAYQGQDSGDFLPFDTIAAFAESGHVEGEPRS